MAHWFNKNSNNTKSFKELLVSNTSAFSAGREARLVDATKETFELSKRDFLNYSMSNYCYDHWLRPFCANDNSSSYRLLKQLNNEDRDEVLGRVAKLFRDEGLECHSYSDSLHLIWKVA